MAVPVEPGTQELLMNWLGRPRALTMSSVMTHEAPDLIRVSGAAPLSGGGSVSTASLGRGRAVQGTHSGLSAGVLEASSVGAGSRPRGRWWVLVGMGPNLNFQLSLLILQTRKPRPSKSVGFAKDLRLWGHKIKE